MISVTYLSPLHVAWQDWDKDRLDRIDSWRDFKSGGKKLAGDCACARGKDTCARLCHFVCTVDIRCVLT